jgi:hypothetical protein
MIPQIGLGDPPAADQYALVQPREALRQPGRRSNTTIE